MTAYSRDTTDSPIAIDFGAGGIKIAYWDEETKDVELMRLGSHGEFQLPAYIGVTANGTVVVGEQAERMINDENEARWVNDNVKRDLSALESLAPRLRFGSRSKPVAHILESVLGELKTRVLQHQAFLGKEPTQVYVTYTLLYPPTIKKLFIQVAKKVFHASEIVDVDEATAAAEMLRNTGASEDEQNDLILLDCGAGTIDCCFLRWSGTRYIIYPLERMKKAYVSIPLGGINIDNALVKLVQEKAGKAFNVRKSSVSVRQQVRLAKHEYCLYGNGAWSIQVNPEKNVAIRPDEIQAAICSEFIDKLCKNLETTRKKPSEHEVLTDYIDEIKGALPIDRTPSLVLVGGCARIPGFDEALHKAFDLHVFKIGDQRRGAYATPLGPIYAHKKKQNVSHGREDVETETRQTSSGVKTDAPFAGPIQALHFSPNRRYLIAAAGDGIRRWVITEENATGVSLEKKRTLQHTDTISALAFSCDSKFFASATHTGDIRLWDAESNIPMTDFKAKDSTITSLAFSPDSTHFATGDQEYKVKLWNLHSGKAVETFVGRKGKYRHKGAVNSFAFSPEGHMLVSGGQDGVVNVWSVRTEQKPLTTHASLPRKVVGALSTFFVNLALQKEHNCPVIHVSSGCYIDNLTLWRSLGLDGTLKYWFSSANSVIDGTIRVITGEGLRHMRSIEPSTLSGMLYDSLYVGDDHLHGSLNVRGARLRFMENGMLKTHRAVDGIPYTDTLSCIAAAIQLDTSTLVALGSQEGRIQLWDGGSELITPP